LTTLNPNKFIDMPAKKEPTKKTETISKSTKKAPVADQYFEAVGRRKESIARARITLDQNIDAKKPVGSNVIINERPLATYFTIAEHFEVVLAPLKLTNLLNQYQVSVHVLGGGVKGQAEATRLALARVLININESLKPILRAAGYLSRDARVVERKKPGLKKARRAPQWKKR
jgi:small subunit ribosomal protein S9